MSEALKRLIEAVSQNKLVTIPTPQRYARESRPETTARIMGYVEGYVVMRHKGAMPFIESKGQVIKYLQSLSRAKLAEADNPATERTSPD